MDDIQKNNRQNKVDQKVSEIFQEIEPLKIEKVKKDAVKRIRNRNKKVTPDLELPNKK